METIKTFSEGITTNTDTFARGTPRIVLENKKLTKANARLIKQLKALRDELISERIGIKRWIEFLEKELKKENIKMDLTPPKGLKPTKLPIDFPTRYTPELRKLIMPGAPKKHSEKNIIPQGENYHKDVGWY